MSVEGLSVEGEGWSVEGGGWSVEAWSVQGWSVEGWSVQGHPSYIHLNRSHNCSQAQRRESNLALLDLPPHDPYSTHTLAGMG